MDESSLSHTRWTCTYHIVFIPKYRRKEIYGKIRRDIGTILRQLCTYKEVEIVEAKTCSDHVHMCVRYAQNVCFQLHGIPERKKQSDDIR